MKKEFKEILEKSRITIKWKNYTSWENEGVENLLEAVESRNIKITGTHDRIKITYCNCNLKITRETPLCYLEVNVLAVLKMFYVYLGDKTKISSRFGTSIIN